MKRYTKRYVRKARKQTLEQGIAQFITAVVTVSYVCVRDGIRAAKVLRKRHYHCDECHKLTFFIRQKTHTIVLLNNGKFFNRMGWYCTACSKNVKRKTEIA